MGIGMIGYGRFGRIAARHLSVDFEIKVSDPAGGDPPMPLGARRVPLAEAASEALVILAVPIGALRRVLKAIAPRVRPGALVVDVCSVKTWPALWMRTLLPPQVDILATHPMFGPDSAVGTLAGRKIVLCRERVAEGRYRKVRNYLTGKGLTVIESDPRRHDAQAAISLSLTHFIGRSLAEYGAGPLPIDTEGYCRLLHILEVVTNDTWELFCDMQRFNPYARAERRAFLAAMERVERAMNRQSSPRNGPAPK